MKPRLALLALPGLCVLALAPAVARADVMLSTTLTHFGWSLTDLRPGDGIAPALSFTTFDESFDASAFVGLGQTTRPPGGNAPVAVERYDQRDAPGAVPFPSLQAGATLPHAEASARMGGDAAAHGFNAATQSRIRVGPNDTALEIATAWSSLSAMPVAEQRDVPNLLLTPYTRVAWSGDVSLAASRTPHPRGQPRETGTAIFSAALFDPASDSPLGTVEEVMSLLPGDPAEQRRDLRLHLEWTNDSADVAGARLHVQLLASADYVLTRPPVPEPVSWALLAGGLGVVGAVAARRRTPAPRA